MQTNFEKQSFPTTLLYSPELEMFFLPIIMYFAIHAIISKL